MTHPIFVFNKMEQFNITKRQIIWHSVPYFDEPKNKEEVKIYRNTTHQNIL